LELALSAPHLRSSDAGADAGTGTDVGATAGSAAAVAVEGAAHECTAAAATGLACAHSLFTARVHFIATATATACFTLDPVEPLEVWVGPVGGWAGSTLG
jgi:hypothetical protein